VTDAKDVKEALKAPAGPAETGPHPEGRARQPEAIPPGAVRYETTDVATGPVLKAVAGLVVGTLLVVLLLLPAFSWLRSRATAAQPPPPPMGRLDPDRQAPEPRLQTRPVQDLSAIRAEDETLLSKYGWVDEPAGVVHIPIEEAMRLVAERGLGGPAAPAPAASPAAAPSAAPPARAQGAH